MKLLRVMNGNDETLFESPDLAKIDENYVDSDVMVYATKEGESTFAESSVQLLFGYAPEMAERMEAVNDLMPAADQPEDYTNFHAALKLLDEEIHSQAYKAARKALRELKVKGLKDFYIRNHDFAAHADDNGYCT